MAHGFICPRLLSLSWDTNTHNEHIYFQFDVQNGRGLHQGSHFHYKNQKHKQSEVHPKCPWSQGVLIKQRQTRQLPQGQCRLCQPQHPPVLTWHTKGHPRCSWGVCASLWGWPGGEPSPRRALLSDLNSIVFLRSLSCWFYSCKLELVLLHSVLVRVL